MDLRDQFAVHIAASLVGALSDPTFIARHAYDLAEAMLSERDRRLALEERLAIAEVHGEPPPDVPPLEHHAALLDEPAPMVDEDEDVEPPYDPTWDLEPAAAAKASVGPGLARTQPEAVEASRASGQ